jgi:hypothetical protein
MIGFSDTQRLLDEAERARIICDACGTSLDGQFRCGCGDAHCPYCGSPESCPHLLAIQIDEGPVGLLPPSTEGAAPDQPSWPEVLALPEYPAAVDLSSLGDSRRREFLGDLAPLLDAYNDGYADEVVFLHTLLALLSVPVTRSVSHEAARFPELLYFTWDATRAYEEATALVHHFKERFARLVASATQG